MGLNCGFFIGWTIADLIQCTIQNIGIPFDILSLGILAGFTMFALWARLDYNIALGLATIISYSLLILDNTGSPLLQFITALLIVGVAVRVLIGIIAMMRQ
jgi:hypothetical protein